MFLIKVANLNDSEEKVRIVNSFKTIEKAASYCRNQNKRSLISCSSEFFYHELDKGELSEMQKEMQRLTN